jgi:hypothetical protein
VQAKLEGHAARTLEFLKDDTQLLSTSFEKMPDGSGFRGEYILWSLSGDPKILRRGSYSHAWRDMGAPHFALARSAGVLFVIDRSATYHRLLQLDLETGAERELLRDEHLFTVATTEDGNRVAVVYLGGNTNVEILCRFKCPAIGQETDSSLRPWRIVSMFLRRMAQASVRTGGLVAVP